MQPTPSARLIERGKFSPQSTFWRGRRFARPGTLLRAVRHNASVLADAIRRFFAAHSLAPRRVLVAVSGGFDSTALFLALHELGGIELVAGHVNHHLRGADSDGDEAFVRDLCARLGIVLRVADGTLADDDVKRVGIEAAARDVRMARLQEIRKATDAGFIATAHQKNDQAETILMRLMTGGGIAALRGIHPVRDDGVIRPLLDVPRAAILAYLAARGVTPRHDRSNDDPRFLRNRVRAMLAESDVDNLAAVAGQAAAQWRVLERAIDEAEDVMAIDNETIFRSLPDDPWLRQALLLRHIRRLDPLARDVSARDLERIATSTAKRESVTKSVELIRRGGRIILRRVVEACPDFEVELTTRAHIAEIGVTLSLSRERDGQLIALPRGAEPRFIVRNRRRGDRFHPLGMPEEIKLKDFLINRKVPAEARDRLPLVVWNGEIVWVAGVEVSERFKVGGGEGDVYAVRIERD